MAHLSSVTGLSLVEIRNLHRYPLIVKRVVNMTSKGKQPSMYALVVVGNGDGLVGLGEGNDESAAKATQKGFAQAVRSMDAVERREGRTVWGSFEGKFGTCRIQMRSRPPGSFLLPSLVSWSDEVAIRIRIESESLHPSSRKSSRYLRPFRESLRLFERNSSHQASLPDATRRFSTSRFASILFR